MTFDENVQGVPKKTSPFISGLKSDFFLGFCERIKVFWTPQLLGYQIEALGVKDKLIGGVTITAFWMILTPPVRLTLTPKWFHLIP